MRFLVHCFLFFLLPMAQPSGRSASATYTAPTPVLSLLCSVTAGLDQEEGVVDETGRAEMQVRLAAPESFPNQEQHLQVGGWRERGCCAAFLGVPACSAARVAYAERVGAGGALWCLAD